MKKSIIIFLLLFLALAATSTMAATWHYDFDAGEDLSQLNFENIVSGTPNPASPTYTLNGNLSMHVPDNKAYDLASWVNLDAPRLYRGVANEPFSLETKLNFSTTTYTFLTGLFLYNTAGGIDAGDLIFGVNSNALKLEKGYPTYHSPPFNWTSIGGFQDLYLQVVHDGSGNYNFFYKTAGADPWILHASLSGYSFDNLGLITKTWYNPTHGLYPDITVNFDYLNYNYVVPIPGAAWLLASGLVCMIGLKRKRHQ